MASEFIRRTGITEILIRGGAGAFAGAHVIRSVVTVRRNPATGAEEEIAPPVDLPPEPADMDALRAFAAILTETGALDAAFAVLEEDISA